MSEWAEREPEPPRVRTWLHAVTGVELFVEPESDGYGVCIQAPPEASIDTVSIGDPETGLFREFDGRREAVDWADEWKDTAAVRRALEPGTASDGGDATEYDHRS